MYKLPPLSLLDDPALPIVDVYKANAMLEQTLLEFGVKAKVVDQKRGPSITRYELKLGPGIRFSKIQNLANDLRLALAAKSIRITQVEETSLVGIDVPNITKDIVTISEILPRAVGGGYDLPIALGKDVVGQPVIADLAKMPHLLVAGATGSGKSVCLNNIIATLICSLTPDELELILIDPKRVELTPYNGIPHLRGRVITNVKTSVLILKALLREMDRRYEMFEAASVQNIKQYNANRQERVPYVVVVIDELANLMMQSKDDVEQALAGITALARATGIHVVVATQRPSVNVVTGVIKANIPSRIAFAVSSQVDSMTIIDQVGAEALLGAGDMFFTAIDGYTPVRAQGALITSAEIARIVKVWSSQGQPRQFIDTDPEEGIDNVYETPVDNLVERVITYIQQGGVASVAAIKRHFSVGHPRALSIVEDLERMGVVGPHDGARARKVLIDRNPIPSLETSDREEVHA